MRLIDADALREVVEGHVTTVSVCPTADWSRGKAEFKKQTLEDIDNAPTINTESVREWIRVKDRLPKLCEPVLFTGKSSYGTRFITQRGWYDGTLWHHDAGETLYSSTPVTHWMPLPEPPKENE